MVAFFTDVSDSEANSVLVSHLVATLVQPNCLPGTLLAIRVTAHESVHLCQEERTWPCEQQHSRQTGS
jgi:hypothetical protein